MIALLFNTLFALIPLIFFKNTSELFEFNKIIVLYVFTILIVSAWIYKSIKYKKIIFKRTILDTPLIIYLCIYAISTLFSVDQRTSILGYYSRFNGGLISQICYTLLYWAYVSNIEKKDFKKSIYYLTFGAVIASILGILEKFGIFVTCGLMKLPFTESCWVQDVKTRVFSTLGQPNWLAALITAIIPITWHQILEKTKLKKISQIFLWTSISIILFTTLIFTGSRSGILAFAIISGLFWSFVFFEEKLKILKVFLIINLLFLSVYFAFKSPLQSNKVTISLKEVGPALEVGGTESGTIRKYVWLGALEIFKNYPFLGTGPETFAFSFPTYKPVEHNLTSEWDFIYNKAHNEYLNYLANIGILGFLSYISIIIFSILQITNYSKGSNFKNYLDQLGKLGQLEIGLLSGYIAILITNFFGFSVVPISILFFLFPAIVVVNNSQKVELPKQNKLNLIQWSLIIVVTLATYYILYTIYSYWRADIYYNKSKSTNDVNDINKALLISPIEPLYVSQLAFINSDVTKSFEASKLSPYNQNVRKVLISNLIKTDNQKAAVEMLLDGIDKSPNDPKLYYQLGIIQLELDETDKGLKSLEKAVELKPNYKEGRFALGITYLALEKYEKARENLEYILKNIDLNDKLTKKYLEQVNSASK